MISDKISRIDNEFSDIAEAVRNGQGYSGKNKFYADFEFGTIENDGSNQDSTIRVRSNFNEVTEKTEYTISTSNNELNVVVYYYDKNGNFLSYIDGWKTLPYSFTTPENCYKIKALFKNDTDTIKIEDITEIQLELGEKATKYEPPCHYKPREISDAILDMIDNFYKFLPTRKVIDGVCENAVNLPIVQFSTAGNNKQKTTKGYNEFNIKRMNLETQDSIKDNIITTHDISLGRNIILYYNLNLHAGEDYFFSFYLRRTIGKYSNSLEQFNFPTVNSTKTLISNPVVTNEFQRYVCKISNITQDTDIDRILIQAFSAVDNVVFEITDIMISKENVDFEEYTGNQPSPNPDYPQDIEVINMVNLFDESKYNDGNYYSYFNGKIQYKNKDNRSLSQISNDEMITLPPGTYTIKLFHNTGYSHSIQFITKSGYSINNISGNTGTFILTQETELFIKPFVALPSSAILPFEFNMQITKGTEEKPYLPYGCIGLEQSGKNLIPCGYQVGYSVNFHSNVKLEILEKNRVKLSGANSTSAISFNYMNDTKNNKINWYKGKTYTLSFKIISGSFSGDLAIHTSYKNDKDNVSVWNNLQIDCAIENSKSVTIEKEGYSPRLIIYARSNTVFNDLIIEIQLEEGTEATSCEPYHEPIIYPINLDGNKLTKVFSLQDTLNIYRSGKVELIKRNDYVDLSTFSGWLIAPSVAEGATRFYIYYSDISQINSKVIISNRFIPLNWTEMYSSDKTTKNAISNITQYSRIIIRISNEIASTPAELKEYFKNNKSYAYYQKLNSEIIELPSIDPIQLWEGTNIFSLITNLDTDYSVEYVVDKNSLTEKTTEQNVE